MDTMTRAHTLDPTVTAWHNLICGSKCPANASHTEALAAADRLSSHLSPDVRANRLHNAVCGTCPAPHEHAARIAARIMP